MAIFKSLREYGDKTKKLIYRYRLFTPAFIIMIIGLSLLVFSKAATPTTFVEPEKGTMSVNAKSIVDSSTSAGGYVRFQKAQIAGSTQRFPGDPNPRVTGKAYWGANVNALLADGSTTSDVYTRHEKPTGKPISLYHRYFQWADIDKGTIPTKAKEDQTAGRLPYVTFKANTDWAAIGNGTYDAQLDKLIAGLDNLGKPVWVTMQHEPENDTDGATRTSTSYRAMQSRFKARMNAANNGTGTKNIAFMPHFMDATTRNNGTRNPNDWWVNGIWDVVMFSNYCQRSCVDGGGNTYDTQARTQSINESRGLPWGVGEWSLSERRTGTLMFTQYFKPYWEYAFINKKDGVAYSYFDADESRPDPTSPYYASLRDANLLEFQRILRDDPRVQRINDLK